MVTATSLYLDLLKKSVLEELYTENEVRLRFLLDCLDGRECFRQDVYLDISRKWPAMYREYSRLNQFGMAFGRSKEYIGFQHTLLNRKRLENIEDCLDTIVAENIPGDCIECGVWRGGAVIFMRGYLAAHQITDRVVWVADSFRGLPVPTAEEDAGLDLSADTYPMLAIDLETVQDLFKRYGLLDDQVRFLPGWFKDTLSQSPVRKLSMLRIDADLYQSTMDVLRALYPKVTAPGGFVIVDDYGALPQCRKAVNDFRLEMKIAAPLQPVDWTAVYWRRDAERQGGN